MMEWLKLLVVQFICIYLLQSVAAVLALHTFTNTKIVKKSFFLTSFLFMMGTLLIIMLPIHRGVHTLLSLLLLILLGTVLLKLPIYTTIKGTLVATVILLLAESVAILVMSSLLGMEAFDALMADPILKYVAGFPSTLVFLLVMVTIHMLKQRRARRHSAMQAQEEEKHAPTLP